MKGELGIVAAGEPLGLRGRLIRQLLQDFLPQLLRLSKKLLILEKHPVQFQRAVRREAFAQNHVADAHWVGKDGVFAEFFQGSSGIVVIHGSNCSPVSGEVALGLRISALVLEPKAQSRFLRASQPCQANSGTD
jgi:hypothetical protein